MTPHTSDMKLPILHALPFVLGLLAASHANAWQQGSLEILTNGLITRSVVCHGPALAQVNTINALPAQVKTLMKGVSDRDGPFNPGDVGGGPRQRFIVGALSKDAALISIERGGIGYNVQLWAFLRNGNTWEPAPSGYFGFDANGLKQDFASQALQAYGCKPTDHPSDTDAQLVAALQKEAENGDAAAQYTLGYFYAIGRVVGKDLKQALKWLKKAAESDPIAQYDLGNLYIEGADVTRDTAAAILYFHLALHSDTGAQSALRRAVLIKLAYLYADGNGVAANPVAAVALLETAGSYGDRQMETRSEQLKKSMTPEQLGLANQLGMDMFPGEQDHHSDIEALDYFISNGKLKSQIKAPPPPPSPKPSGETYYRHQDYPNARQDLALKAAQGDGKAAVIMGAMSLWGRGTPQNLNEAADWFGKGASQGDPVAMADLASMYQDGRGMPPDLSEALTWYGKAASKGERRAALILPVIKAVALQRTRSHLPMTAPLSDTELFGLEGGECNAKIKKVLQDAESHLAVTAVPLNSAAALPGQLSLMASFVPTPYELYAELAAEYSWAGCFADAARVMDSHKSFGRIARDNALYEVADALVHHGATSRAVALAYTAETERTQERIIWRILTRIALDGRADSTVDLGETLVKQDGQPITAASYVVAQNLLKAADYRNLIKVDSTGPLRDKLEVEGNLDLADAYFHLNDTKSALRALQAAESNLPQNHPDSTKPSGYSPGHLARLQALLKPETVDTTLDRSSNKQAIFRIETLNYAVAAAREQTWRQHWVDEIDSLTPNAQEQLKSGRLDMTNIICGAADSHASVAHYQKALDLRQQWHCEKNAVSPNALADNLAGVLRVAAINNAVSNAVEIIPADMRESKSTYRPYLMPLLFGYERAGEHDRALAVLRQLTSMANRPQENLIETIAEVGQIADINFPVDAWIAEIRTNRMRIGLSKWDTYRILFAVCARTRGVDEANRLAAGLSADDMTAADIGIAEGSRHYQIAPNNPIFIQR